MGAFLSEPVTEKVCTDEEHPRLHFGVCSMQGWRFTQEDNHSCCPSLDEGSSLFGVYDGHGGAEVSRYVASLLPDYVLARECWGKGDAGRALSEAFLALDAHLGSRKGLRTLKRFAAEDDAALHNDEEKLAEEDDGEGEDGSEENIRKLFKEAKMPLDRLMAKYGQALASARIAADAGEGSPTGSKAAKESNATTSNTDDDADTSAVDEKGESATALKKGEDGGGTASEDAEPKGNGVEEGGKEEPEGAKAGSARNGTGGRSKLRSRTNRLVMTDEDDDSEEDSSDEEYDENSSSLIGEGSEEEESSEDGEGGDDDEDDLERSISTSEEFALNMLQGPGLDSGCTAVVSVVCRGGVLYVANAGDSRCILSRKGRAVDMSVDHKPEDDAESERIREAGGEVTSEGRVNGGLNLSRALGDHAYKQGADIGARKQMISALPDVRRVNLRKDEDEFMVLACDGIWNSMTSQDVVDFVRERLYKGAPMGDSVEDLQKRRKMAEGVKLSQICGEMFDSCLAPNTCGDGTGCDNMTAILVTFREALWEGGEPAKAVDGVAEAAKEESAKGEEKGTKEDAKVDGSAKAEESEDDDGDADAKARKKLEEEEGIVLLTPPPSPAPIVATGEEEEEESSEEEEEEEEILEDEEDEEGEGEGEEGEDEDEEEEALDEEGGLPNGKGGKGCKRRSAVADTVADTGSKLKKRKVEGEEGEGAVSTS